MTIAEVVSGGQTGVDRAALDVALERGLPCGGWCPRGRRAEDGPIPDRYPLRETPWDGYPQRTRWNVRDSDGTLVLTRGTPDRGTALTIRLASAMGKPCLVLDLAEDPDPAQAAAWAEANGVRKLNVAGPRESSAPGIQAQAAEFLRRLLARGRSGRDRNGERDREGKSGCARRGSPTPPTGGP
jgi:hypothetical protein